MTVPPLIPFLLLAGSSWTLSAFFFTSMMVADGGIEISKPTQESNRLHRASAGGSLAATLHGLHLADHPIADNTIRQGPPHLAFRPAATEVNGINNHQPMTLSWHKQALAAIYASSCVSLNDHRNIILAVGRSKVMISKINSPEANRSPMSIVIHDIKKMLSKFLVVSFVIFVVGVIG